tara:strand:- start:3873 stop:4646 length:774 start_codon:yes stop_codon:yes gene_type:complete
MDKLFTKNSFKEILDNLDIKKTDNILVNSNILNLILESKDKDLPSKIINTLIEQISPFGTLLFPTFNWDFCRGLNFNLKKTKSSTGALSNLSLEMKNFVRSKNPIYSFSIFGQNKNEISKLEHNSCFGLDSPFGYLIKNKGKNLFIDLDYKDALTFVHVAEENVGVNYRHHKKFTGKYINEKKIEEVKSYEMYVRKKEIVSKTLIDAKFDDQLLRNNALKKISYNNIIFSIVDIPIAYNLMVEDIKLNRGLIRPILN